MSDVPAVSACGCGPLPTSVVCVLLCTSITVETTAVSYLVYKHYQRYYASIYGFLTPSVVCFCVCVLHVKTFFLPVDHVTTIHTVSRACSVMFHFVVSAVCTACVWFVSRVGVLLLSATSLCPLCLLLLSGVLYTY